MTFLQVINSVLRRLRESEVTSSVSTAYSKLIADFVNETLEEIEKSWDWSMLRQTITINTSDGIDVYPLTGVGDQFRILQIFNDSQDFEMRETTYAWIKRQTLIGTPQRTAPLYYTIEGKDSNGDSQLLVYPVPNTSYTIKASLVVYQAPISVDSTGDSTKIKIPTLPLILGAYSRAVSERGEDGATTTGEAEAMYASALADAISKDAANFRNELVWEVN